VLDGLEAITVSVGMVWYTLSVMSFSLMLELVMEVRLQDVSSEYSSVVNVMVTHDSGSVLEEV